MLPTMKEKRKVNLQLLGDARLRLGLSVDDLARETQLGYWQVWSVLNGRSAKPANVKALAEALRVPIGDVWGFNGD